MERFMTNNNFKDPFDRIQYLIFKVLLLLLFLATVYKILDYEFHISQNIMSFFGK
jgi:hypothetical protein